MAEEWRVVKRKNSSAARASHRGPVRHQQRPQHRTLPPMEDDEVILISSEEYLLRLRRIRSSLTQTQVYSYCHERLRLLSSSLHPHPPGPPHPVGDLNQIYKQIVVCGIGNFLKSSSATLQLALTLELFENHSNVFICDPILSSQEIQICQLLNLKVYTIGRGGEGGGGGGGGDETLHEAYQEEDGMTFFYMPHCPYSLYNKILWSNWGENLRKIVILGNSFQSYSLRRIADDNSRSDCMKLLEDLITEIEIWKNEFRHDEVLKRCSSCHELYSLENAFNDTSLMHFRKESEHWNEILSVEKRPTEEDMMADLENDLELIRQEIK